MIRLPELPPSSGAVFDATGQYRYLLQREWSSGGDRITFIMLNPSTADATTNDTTIRRCCRFAQQWGYGGLRVVNLFAYRATHPSQLRRVADPIGRDCDAYLRAAIRAATIVVAAWGNGGQLHQRDQAVLNLLSGHVTLYCLGQTRLNQPLHPLYCRSTMPLQRYNPMPRHDG